MSGALSETDVALTTRVRAMTEKNAALHAHLDEATELGDLEAIDRISQEIAKNERLASHAAVSCERLSAKAAGALRKQQVTEAIAAIEARAADGPALIARAEKFEAVQRAQGELLREILCDSVRLRSGIIDAVYALDRTPDSRQVQSVYDTHFNIETLLLERQRTAMSGNPDDPMFTGRLHGDDASLTTNVKRAVDNLLRTARAVRPKP